MAGAGAEGSGAELRQAPARRDLSSAAANSRFCRRFNSLAPTRGRYRVSGRDPMGVARSDREVRRAGSRSRSRTRQRGANDDRVRPPSPTFRSGRMSLTHDSGRHIGGCDDSPSRSRGAGSDSPVPRGTSGQRQRRLTRRQGPVNVLHAWTAFDTRRGARHILPCSTWNTGRATRGGLPQETSCRARFASVSQTTSRARRPQDGPGRTAALRYP